MRCFQFLFFGLAFVLFACKNSKNNISEPTNSTKIEEVSQIDFGSSFGMCRGYCRRWVSFTKDKVTYFEASYDTLAFPTKSFTENSNVLESLIQQMNWKSWDTLSPNIGCPDCTDAGAEYIVVYTPRGNKKVRFDAGSNPEVLGAIVPRMRFVRERMNKKLNNPE